MQRVRALPSQDYLRECFSYNLEVGELTWRERPLSHFQSLKASANTRWAGRRAGTISSDGHRIVTLDFHRYKASRLIFKLMTGEDPIQVDHRDRDRANDRWDNLRNATSTENHANQGAQRTNKLGIKGVRRWRNGFEARITVGNRSKHLGMFDTAEAAHAAYCDAARKQWNEFAAGG